MGGAVARALPVTRVSEPTPAHQPVAESRDRSRSSTVRHLRGARADAAAIHASDDVSARLTTIEREEGGEGTVQLPGGGELAVTSLGRVVFPARGHTKGDLLRYYAAMAPLILPSIADRPLVLRRYPRGLQGPSFFQQKASERPPQGVRVETITGAGGEEQRRYVGGNLVTLLHTIQLGAISVDPWNARVGSLDRVDFAILDLDPGPGATFGAVVEAARLLHGVLVGMGHEGRLKTSGKRGLHIHLPLPGGASEDEALALAEEAAARVAMARPDVATIERSVDARPPGTVYLDYLQNVIAKPVAAAYSVRATATATVSMPVGWEELTDDLDPGAFTIATVSPDSHEPWLP